MCFLSPTRKHTIFVFFYCTYAKFLWHSVHILFGIDPHVDIADLFDIWSKMGTSKHNIACICSSHSMLGNMDNQKRSSFNKCRPQTFLQVLFRGTHWLRQWAKFQRHEDRHEELVQAARHLESSALHFFHSNCWLSLGELVLRS